MRPVRVNFSAGRLERGMPMTVSYVGSGTVRRKTERRSLNRQSRKTGTMNTKAEIQTMLAAYTARYPDERAAMEPFVRYVASFDTPALYDRKNFVGHLTAGALIVSRQTGCVLLLKHKQLGKWLQPGGHVEASDASVLDAAFREAREETGIGRDRLELLAPSGSLLPVPADADGHYIPPCPSKGEDEHRHFDMRFVFLFDGDPRVVIDRAESDGFRWVTLDELASMPDFRRIVPKIRAALSERGIAF